MNEGIFPLEQIRGKKIETDSNFLSCLVSDKSIFQPNFTKSQRNG